MNTLHDLRFISKILEKNYDLYVVSFAIRSEYLKKIKGLKHIHYPIPKWNFIINSILLKWEIYRFKPDIIHGNFVQTTGFYSALSGFHPFLLMAWGSDILVHPKKSRILKFIAKYSISKADAITCDCEEVKREIINLANYPAEKIITFPVGIDHKLFNPDIVSSDIKSKLGLDNKKIIISNRNFFEVYGIEFLLYSLPKVIEKIPDIRILLIGTGPLQKKHMETIENLGINEYIKVLGSIPNNEMAEYLNISDVYVTTSLSDGTSLSLLEAMACGLPIIATDVPANLEWIVDSYNGFVVPRRDPEELAEKIIYLLQNESLQKKMGDLNLKIAKERADWDVNFEKLANMYETLCKEKGDDSN